ncbi:MULTISPECIES: GNAT family N-acetyltransferase [Hoeflea]|uniref:GNAT family N-acetyltransferase n=1 Tax=Hoeflea alexandrii TaxID=288436 RepID=A0ABT1CML8_9HYPH|nr:MULTISPECIES: N-acetyltransferase [Hoeflea]MBV6649801.1 GNAT family N-acetyltransferase [Hoeflea sp.]MCO6406611.1 GNAT family N-acetyltransferase [Hoeflea alexandrii]MCY0154894.1 GNAT family N-acetyltransferase [Hoeflea alexandrii]VVT27585.1 GNAT family N-acetyltransferase [Hoeflea sp. EC-HK425]
MDDIIIRRAIASDAVDLNRALGQLSADMGDQHRAGDGDIARFCFGPAPVFHALLAVAQDGTVVGAVAYSPFFSTVYGGVGVYVSDLWVDAQTRGKRLGQRLLAAVRAEGIRMWDAQLMRLNVYHDNPKALAFYERIGFVPVSDTQYLTLSGEALESLGEQA